MECVVKAKIESGLRLKNLRISGSVMKQQSGWLMRLIPDPAFRHKAPIT